MVALGWSLVEREAELAGQCERTVISRLVPVDDDDPSDANDREG